MRSKDHEREAQKDGELAESCKAMAETFSGMAKAAGSDGPTYMKIANHWTGIQKIHEKSRDDHTEACNTAKAQEAELAKRIQPDRFSAFPTSDTPAAGFGFTARPFARAGQPDPDLNKAMAGVAPEFRDLLGGFDDEI